MKKKIRFFFAMLLAGLALSSCTLADNRAAQETNDTVTGTYIITFESNNGDEQFTKKTNEYQRISEPEEPTKEGYIFEYWCEDILLTKKFDFSKKVMQTRTLYAKYIPDYKSWTNKMSTSDISGTVKVISEVYRQGFGGRTTVASSTGSGVIFYEDLSYYYCLTNNHVVAKSSTYSSYSIAYSIEDYKGNIITAQVYMSSGTPNYDLAIVRFQKKENELNVFNLAKTNPSINEEALAVGYPLGQANTLTYGTINKFEYMTPNSDTLDISNVTFEVLGHDAFINSGSSGGGLFNPANEIIGINYATTSDKDGNYISSYAIPVEKIKEYLKAFKDQGAFSDLTL